ncbi:23S rRNA A2030 N6-methylase RlmJ [Gulbenkiania indica]|uniref:Ribosomal RNA large subunit methyltransferase J n=1 Tax=Gulbenkiania indica TaxID=375574 RepID=A0A0K6GV48_9NEIS|nr:23S rRNA (adenine(2030)-N(6))-methyltransferase RlmJ [Gulbenkiania indica]CUA82621.1 23S rRNA A2030 N6-methylase RlmJ [Gulbenkiania indica]
MLSYRHAFHAGNHADVLKHFVEIELLRYLGQKGTPFWYLDTHAGAGVYALTEGYAARNAEHETGIARLWDRSDLPPTLQPYLETVRALNPDGRLRLYPGSPWCAAHVMDSGNKLRLFELHPTDHQILAENFAEAGRRVQIRREDGFEGIKALLPPPPRRALTLIDPPYEDKRDYQHVVSALKEALKRFATGVYAIWYPRLQRVEARTLPENLKKLPAKNWLHVAVDVATPSTDGFGMHGSGMFILNAPWTLPGVLQETLPWLTAALATDDRARFILETGGDL